MIHAVKCYPKYFKALKSGEKTFEVRENDRAYKVGDYLAVNEFESEIIYRGCPKLPKNFVSTKGGYYTGKSLLFQITYILDEPEYCARGKVILALKRIDFESGGDSAPNR